MSYRGIREIYAIHPFDFGKKERASKAMIIPAGIVKEFHIDKNTVLILRPHQNGTFTIETIKGSERFDQKNMIPVDKSFQASGQQVSAEIQ
jgi:hypothetical protein